MVVALCGLLWMKLDCVMNSAGRIMPRLTFAYRLGLSRQNRLRRLSFVRCLLSKGQALQKKLDKLAWK
jgi:hypothetical protein